MAPHPSFRTVRWWRNGNLLAQAVLLLTFGAGLNLLALHYGWRFDFTAAHRNSLSPETKAYLNDLTQPVRIVVTVADESDDDFLRKARSDLGELLGDYARAAPSGRLTTEFIDVDQNHREAVELAVTQANCVLVLAGEHNERRQVVTMGELYLNEGGEIKAFRGEQALTAAILDVTNPVKKRISFLRGDGEMDPADTSNNDRGLSGVADELRQRNFAVDSIDLTTARSIPKGTDLLVVAGPQGRLLPATVELLRQYLGTKAGRMLVLLSPGNPHGMDDLLEDWGVVADDVLICDSGPAGQNDTGDLILTAAAGEHPHPVIRSLVENGELVRFGAVRSVRPDPGRSLDASLEVTPLIGTSAKTAWGERNYRDHTVPVFRPGIDLPPPLTVATAAERVTTGGGLTFNVPGGRLVAFGGTDWIANSRESTHGNLALFLDAVNWTIGRSAQSNIPSRKVDRLQLALTQQQLQRLRYSFLLAVPSAVALLGLTVWWTRRR